MKAATNLFSQKGYKETSMAELAAMTGVAQGTIFYHYATKEELFISILREFKDDLVKEFREYVDARSFENGLAMVEDLLSFYLSLAGAMEDRFRLLHRHYAYELARTNTVCRGLLETIYYCLVGMFEHAIVVGQKDGSIGKLDSNRTALVIFTIVDGLVRFNTYSLYDASSLYSEVLQAVRSILQAQDPSRKAGISEHCTRGAAVNDRSA